MLYEVITQTEREGRHLAHFGLLVAHELRKGRDQRRIAHATRGEGRAAADLGLGMAQEPLELPVSRGAGVLQLQDPTQDGGERGRPGRLLLRGPRRASARSPREHQSYNFV